MKKKILIIDDEETYVDILKIHLEQSGKFEIESVFDAQSGFEKINGSNYDLILLDILMPKIEGHEALAKIKNMCKTPVIIMSGYLAPQQKQFIMKAGADACFMKTDNLDKIFHLIQQCLFANEKGQ